jgi:hypothetical protein
VHHLEKQDQQDHPVVQVLKAQQVLQVILVKKVIQDELEEMLNIVHALNVQLLKLKKEDIKERHKYNDKLNE